MHVRAYVVNLKSGFIRSKIKLNFKLIEILNGCYIFNG